MTDWGGKREGAGRKASSGKTVVMRIPESKIEEVKQLISGVTNEKINDFSELKELVSRWEAIITPDRMKQPRWENAGRLLNELKELIK